MKNDKQTLGIREAAIKLNFTMKYLYDLVYSGRLRATKVGRQWRIPLSAIEERLQQRGK
jgi:excisionase family DNA binding protein